MTDGSQHYPSGWVPIALEILLCNKLLQQLQREAGLAAQLH